MPDIFISYSRKDSAQALELAERLRAEGMGVWIDQHGIDAATSYSHEIVQALDEARAMLVLLSQSSIESHSVIRELTLAFEAKKAILPVSLEKVTLPTQFRYLLAGIQRAKISDVEGIVRSLSKLGLGRTATLPPPGSDGARPAVQTDTRKTLIILPFEDHSPMQDHQWFADGLSGELIDAMSGIKSLRILDRTTSKGLRGVKQTMKELGVLFDTRYFVEGSVTKVSDTIKISAALIDIEAGEHVWRDSIKGTMGDIFAIQESVTAKVVEGLKLHLTREEKSLLARHGTENSEAFELYIKAGEYLQRHTLEGIQLDLRLLNEAIRLDPGYAEAYLSKATALIALYRGYDHNPEFLNEAESLCRLALQLKPELFSVYEAFSSIAMLRGNLEEAEEIAKELVRKYPEDYNSHTALGFFYMETFQRDKAIAPYEAAVRLNPNRLVTLWNLVINCDAAGEMEKRAKWSAVALPLIERHLRLHPDDEHNRVVHAALLLFTGRTEEALTETNELANLKDGHSLYDTACLFQNLGDSMQAMRVLQKALDAGFRGIPGLWIFLDGDLAPFAGTPEYEALKANVKRIEAEEAAKVRG